MNLVFHIGLPRVASTTLQQSVFPKSSDVNLINFYRNDGVKWKVIMDKDVNHFLEEDFLKYSDEKIKKLILPLCKPSKVNIVSDENIYAGGMWIKKDNRFERALKLKRCFPNCRILLGVRNKKNLLFSWYKKYIVNGGILSFNEFKKKWINEDILDWEPFVDFISELFNDVYIYHLKELKEDFTGFFTDIFDWLDCNKYPKQIEKRRWNRGYSLWQLKFSRLVNHLFKSECNPVGILPISYKWHPHRILFQSNLFPDILRGKNPSSNEDFI